MKFKKVENSFMFCFSTSLTSYRQVVKIVVVAHSLKKSPKIFKPRKNHKLISQQIEKFLVYN